MISIHTSTVFTGLQRTNFCKTGYFPEKLKLSKKHNFLDNLIHCLNNFPCQAVTVQEVYVFFICIKISITNFVHQLNLLLTLSHHHVKRSSGNMIWKCN